MQTLVSSFISTKWFLFNAKNQSRGRLLTNISKLISSKCFYFYTPYLKPFISIIIINSNLLLCSTKNLKKKYYYKPTNRPGNLKKIDHLTLFKKNSIKFLEQSLRNMLTKTKKTKQALKNVYIYPTDKLSYD